MRKSLHYLNEADRYDAAGRTDLANVMFALADAELRRETTCGCCGGWFTVEYPESEYPTVTQPDGSDRLVCSACSADADDMADDADDEVTYATFN